MIKCVDELIESWGSSFVINKFNDILNWINKKNEDCHVSIKKIDFQEMKDWFLNTISGRIEHKNGAFFSIAGIKSEVDGINQEQPIIIQDEIGFLGIICKKINGVLFFLMQAKIEPGNINKIQISPTLQATKSNFEQKHGGRKPKYIEYFLNKDKYVVIVDQIQSEQSSRFFKKRNRNIIIKVNDDIVVENNFIWLTLGQIKKLMNYDNLVNMDTRTVLSCIPFWQLCFSKDNCKISNKYLSNSLSEFDANEFQLAFSKINDYKMFHQKNDQVVRLDEINTWEFKKNEYVCKQKNNFKVIFCELEIEGREVKKWCQPLFEATGIATFCLMYTIVDGKYKYLVHFKKEIGCFDTIEVGPTIQKEFIDQSPHDAVEELFYKHLKDNSGIKKKVLLSEEGGRFYHEQNYNYLIFVDKNEFVNVPNEYMWVSFNTLNLLCQFNNVLNIQLRNLLSLVEDN